MPTPTLAVSFEGAERYDGIGSEPNPEFALREPTPGADRIAVEKLLFEPLHDELRVAGGRAADTVPSDGIYYVLDAGAPLGPLSDRPLLERIVDGRTDPSRRRTVAPRLGGEARWGPQLGAHHTS